MNKEWERLYEEAMSVLNPHDVSKKMWVLNKEGRTIKLIDLMPEYPRHK